jgi:hypothetical protein
VPSPPGLLPGRIAPLGATLLPLVASPVALGVALPGAGAPSPGSTLSDSAEVGAPGPLSTPPPGIGWVCGVPRFVPDVCAATCPFAASDRPKLSAARTTILLRILRTFWFLLGKRIKPTVVYGGIERLFVSYATKWSQCAVNSFQIAGATPSFPTVTRAAENVPSAFRVALMKTAAPATKSARAAGMGMRRGVSAPT